MFENKDDIMNKIIILLPLSLILLNIKLFTLIGAAIKPAHVIVLLLIICGITKQLKAKSVILLLFYLILPLFGWMNLVDLKEFIKSYFNYSLTCLLIFIGIMNYRFNYKSLKTMFKILFRMFNLTVIYGIVQFFLANVFKSLVLYNNMGRFQFHPHYYNQIFGINRATSIYIEPSVYAWVCSTIIVLLFYLKNHNIVKREEYYFTLGLAFIGILTSFSASGFISICVITIVMLINSNKTMRSFMICFSLFFLLLFIIHPDIIKYLRLYEIFNPGSSGYIRLIEPLFATIETIRKYPAFGRGLGQIDVYNPIFQHNVVIHNSIYGVIITFGLTSLLYFIPIIHNFFRKIMKNKNSLPLFVNLFFVFITTGGFLALELPVIYCLSILAIDLNNYLEGSLQPEVEKRDAKNQYNCSCV